MGDNDVKALVLILCITLALAWADYMARKNRKAEDKSTEKDRPGDPSDFDKGASPGHGQKVTCNREVTKMTDACNLNSESNNTRSENKCEQLLESIRHLEKCGFTENQLYALHHFSLKGSRKPRYAGLYKYFGTKKKLELRNTKFSDRLIYVATQHKDGKRDFAQLISEALDKWPLVW